MNTYDGSEHVNIATGEEYSIRELTNILKEIVGYQGEIAFTSIQPNGTPRKILDTSKATLLGWKPSIKLADGLKQICENMKNEF
jgi:GDP-L-fucose synthase